MPHAVPLDHAPAVPRFAREHAADGQVRLEAQTPRQKQIRRRPFIAHAVAQGVHPLGRVDDPLDMLLLREAPAQDALAVDPAITEGTRAEGLAAAAADIIVCPQELLFLRQGVVVDEVLMRGVQGISDIITKPGLINVDFADVRSVMLASGSAVMGIGKGEGEGRATEAAKQAISSPLLETSIDGATDAIINVTGGNNLTLFEVEEAAEVIRTSANTDMNAIFGAVINENLNDEVIVTVIATGFDDPSEPLYHSYTRPNGVDDDRNSSDDDDDDSGIPTFLRKRGGF